jgi:hypothetical protein
MTCFALDTRVAVGDRLLAIGVRYVERVEVAR